MSLNHPCGHHWTAVANCKAPKKPLKIHSRGEDGNALCGQIPRMRPHLFADEQRVPVDCAWCLRFLRLLARIEAHKKEMEKLRGQP